MKTRRDDAASMVGDELAEELEKRQKALTQRSDSGIAPGAVVIKDDQSEEAAEGEPSGTVSSPQEEAGEGEGQMKSVLNGAVTLDEAEKALAERSDGVVYLDDWGVLRAVLTNIAPDKAEAIGAVLEDFQSRVDVMAVKAVARIDALIADEVEAQPPVAPEPVSQEEHIMQGHPLGDAIQRFTEAFDEAVATPFDQNSQAAMIQPALNDLGEAVVRALEVSHQPGEPAPAAAAGSALTAQDIRQIVGELVQPLSNEIAQLKAEGTVARRAPETPVIPTRRAIRIDPASVGNGSTVSGSVKPNSIRAIARRSVGIRE